MKENILAKLYHGNIEPMGEVFKQAQKHTEQMQGADVAEEFLQVTFNNRQQELYEKLIETKSNVNTIIEDLAFSEGLKLGLQIATATYFENDDQLIKKWLSFFMEERQ